MTKQAALALLSKMTAEHLGAVYVDGKWIWRCDLRAILAQ